MKIRTMMLTWFAVMRISCTAISSCRELLSSFNRQTSMSDVTKGMIISTTIFLLEWNKAPTVLVIHEQNKMMHKLRIARICIRKKSFLAIPFLQISVRIN
jgi:hypothetical protein